MNRPSHLGRKQIRQPDPFVALIGKAAQALRPHAKWLALAGVVALVGAGVAWGIQFREGQRSAQLNATLSTAMKAYEKSLQENLTGGDPQWEATRQQFESLYDQARGTSIEAIVALYLFNVFFEQGNLEAASGVAVELSNAARDNVSLRVVALVAQARIADAKGDSGLAIEMLDQAGEIVPNPLGAIIADEVARIKRGRLPSALVAQYAPPVSQPAAAAAEHRIILEADDLK